MANDRSNFFFNVLALENILVALTIEIGDGPCFLYIEFSWIGVQRDQTVYEFDFEFLHSYNFTKYFCQF